MAQRMERRGRRQSYTDQLLTNIRALGFDPKDIKLVVITHGHRDHAGGAARLKSSLSSTSRPAHLLCNVFIGALL
jgi:metal-dependent hydrolase (beta-lactamase superfamily II)